MLRKGERRYAATTMSNSRCKYKSIVSMLTREQGKKGCIHSDPSMLTPGERPALRPALNGLYFPTTPRLPVRLESIVDLWPRQIEGAAEITGLELVGLDEAQKAVGRRGVQSALSICAPHRGQTYIFFTRIDDTPNPRT